MPEQLLREQAEEEDRRRVDDDPVDPCPGVEPAVTFPAGEHPERDADDESDEHCRHRELERRGPVLRDHLGDGTVVGEGGAKVSGDDLFQVLAVLDDERLVLAADPFTDSELGPGRGDLRAPPGSDCRPRRASGGRRGSTRCRPSG